MNVQVVHAYHRAQLVVPQLPLKLYYDLRNMHLLE